MKRIIFAAALAAALTAGYAARGLFAGEPAAAAHAVKSEDTDAAEWEFCAVARAQFLPGPRGNQYWIVYFRGEGVQVVTVEAGVSGNAQGKAIARLGAEGWQLVGEGTLDTGRPPSRDEPAGRALFFKRLKNS